MAEERLDNQIIEDRFEKLETLRKAAWESISNRRQFEWQVSIPFWTLLAVFIGKFGNGSISVHWCFLFFPSMLGIAHTIWLFGLWSAYQIDKPEEGAFREEMRRVAPYNEPKEITKQREKAKNWPWKYWNLTAQLLMTWTLVILAIFVVLGCGIQHKESPQTFDKSAISGQFPSKTALRTTGDSGFSIPRDSIS